MANPSLNIVPRMEDVLRRTVEFLEQQESRSRDLLDSLNASDEPEATVIDALETLSISGSHAERGLFEEYRILRKEWDAGRDAISQSDRDRMNRLGEQVQALSFSIHGLYNQIADRLAAFADRDRDESANLRRVVGALRRYRPDSGEDHRGFSIRA